MVTDRSLSPHGKLFISPCTYGLKMMKIKDVRDEDNDDIKTHSYTGYLSHKHGFMMCCARGIKVLMCCIRHKTAGRVCYTSAAHPALQCCSYQDAAESTIPHPRPRTPGIVAAQTSVVCELLSATECPETGVIMASSRQIVSALALCVIIQIGDSASIPAQYRFSYSVRKWGHSAPLSQDSS